MPWSFEEDLERIQAAGYTRLEVCEKKIDAARGPEQMRALLDRGYEPISVQARVHSIFPDSMAAEPTDPTERIQRIEQTMDWMAPFLPARTPFVVITGIAPDNDIEHAWNTCREALPRLASHAALLGMRVVFEPLNPVNLHTDTAVWGWDQGIELLSGIEHDALGFCFDSWNVFMTPHLTHLIRQVVDRIWLVQLSDWRRPRAQADRVSLGDGVIHFEPMFRALSEAPAAWALEMLSDPKLPDSFWNGDISETLRHNAAVFERLWRRVEATPATDTNMALS
jgi:sugar phosphate isomerase/epimerase